MRKLLACLLVLLTLAGAAAADDYAQSYDLFQTYYADNLDFISLNTGKHLMPLSFKGEFNARGERIYVLESGALYVQIKLDDEASHIASCQVTLTAPSGMQHGDQQYKDFTISGYHSYAFVMAMHPAADAYTRYQLVEELNAAFSQGSSYQTEVGDYVLMCTSQNGAVTMLFENALLLGRPVEEAPAEAEEEGAAPSIEIKH